MKFIVKPIEHSINFDPSEYDAVYERLIKILQHQEVSHDLINQNTIEFKKMGRPTMHETIIFSLGDGNIEINQDGALKLSSTNSVFRKINIIAWIVCLLLSLPIFFLLIDIIQMIISDWPDSLILFFVAFILILMELLLVFIIPGLICKCGLNKKGNFAAHTFLKYLTRVNI